MLTHTSRTPTPTPNPQTLTLKQVERYSLRFYSSAGGVPLSNIARGTFNVSVSLEREASLAGGAPLDVSHRLAGTRSILASWDASLSAHASFTDLEIRGAGGNLRLRFHLEDALSVMSVNPNPQFLEGQPQPLNTKP